MKEEIMFDVNENAAWDEISQLAELDMAAREGVSMFDKANARAGEISLETGALIDGFQAVDTSADPADVADEDEDASLRRLTDFYLRTDWAPSGAVSEMLSREQSDTPYLDVDELEVA
jgi:hypothetical protein